MTNADELKTQLEAACDDLWWSSEADYPITVVWQSQSALGAAAKDSLDIDSTVRQVLACPPEQFSDNAVKTRDIEDFFGRAVAPQSWHTDDDKAHISRLQTLKQFLSAHFSQLQVYCCGEVTVSVAILGYAPDGSMAGSKRRWLKLKAPPKFRKSVHYSVGRVCRQLRPLHAGYALNKARS
ncbi:MAG: hypothetical protein HC800_16110 [Phormidesmis sp. RL_2_1]|nr:hypothetical protein [Phormidesmis sp. RL_2_1]